MQFDSWVFKAKVKAAICSRENPIDRMNWKKLAGGTHKVPCSKLCE